MRPDATTRERHPRLGSDDAVDDDDEPPSFASIAMLLAFFSFLATDSVASEKAALIVFAAVLGATVIVGPLIASTHARAEGAELRDAEHADVEKLAARIAELERAVRDLTDSVKEKRPRG